MIALDAGQALLASKGGLQIATLVRIRTYSNVLTSTLSETFYLATLPLLYQWTAPTVTPFEPLVVSVSPVVRGFPHIPDGETQPTRDGITIQLDGRVRREGSLWARMQARQLIGARVDVASLLLPVGQLTRGADWFDVSSMGAVATMRWRGEVEAVSDFDWDAGEFSLSCSTVEPAIAWPFAGDSSVNDPRDSGKRYPMPFGAAPGVELVGREVGWSTTLAGALAASGTATVAQTDGSGFPSSGTFLVKIGSEILSVNGSTSTRTSLVVTARAQEGTTAAAHPIGATVTEYVREARFVVSAREAKAITALYWQLNGAQLVRLEPSLYGWNPGSDAVESGQTLGVVTFDREQLAAAIDVVAAVNQQPSFDIAENETIRLFFDGVSSSSDGPASVGPAVSSTAVVLTGDPAGVRLNWDAGGPDDQVGIFFVSTIDAAEAGRKVVRVRPVFDMRVESGAADPTVIYYEVDSISIGGSLISESKTLLISQSGNAETRQKLVGDWMTPSNPDVFVLGDLVGSASMGLLDFYAAVYLDQTGGGDGIATTEAFIYAFSSYWEVEVEPAPISRTLPVDVVAGWSVGNGLKLLADVSGIVSRSGEAAISGFDFSTTTGWTASDSSISVQTIGSRQGIRCNSPADTTIGLRRTGLTLNYSGAGASLSVEVYITAAHKDMLDGTQGDAVSVRLISSGGNETNLNFGPADLVDDAWATLVVDVASHPNRSISGSGANVAALIEIRFGVRWRSSTLGSNPAVYFRNARSMVRTLVDHPIDVGAFVVTSLAGQASGVDTSAATTAKANLPSVVLAADLRRFGDSFGDIMARLEFESRANWVPIESASGTIWRPLAASTAYAWPAAARTLTAFHSLTVASRQLPELVSEFSALYDYRPSQQSVDVEAFRAIARADSVVNEISADVSSASLTAAREAIGIRASEPQAFVGLVDSTSLREVWAYYVKEALRFSGRRFALVAEYSEAADLEPGDVVEFVTPWDAATVKARVVRIAYPMDAPGVGLTLEEVT